ncbi:MAG: hypothetical protein AAFV90_21975 [Cyanobacteria bacterium J06634_5]
MKGLLSLFDLVSFLLPGFLFLGILELITENNLFPSITQITPIPLLIYAGIAYILGQAVDSCSQFFIEQLIIKKWLGHPAYYLIRQRRVGRVFSIFFREYCSPLPKPIRDKLLKRATKDGIDNLSESVPETEGKSIKNEKKGRITSAKNSAIIFFDTTYHLAIKEFKRDLSLLLMKEFFLKYNFARNAAFVAFIGFVLTIIGTTMNPLGEFKTLSLEDCLLLAVPLIFVFVTLFFRLLKFYRLYAYELLTAYASVDGHQGVGFY